MGLVACGNAAPDSGFGDRSADNGGFGNDNSDNGGGTIGGKGGDAPSAPAGDLAACATATAAATAKPVYLVFAYDKSGSMKDNGKWDAAKAAMQSFFGSPDSKGISASLTFFPQGGNICNSNNYASPNADMGALPNTALSSALDANGPGGGTPTADALSGVISYATSLQSGAAKDGTVAIVMVTDGIPDGCNDTDDPSVAASEALGISTSIKTYVVGVGDQLSNLNQIAASGGTKSAFVVSVGNPAQTQSDLTKAINQIRDSALSCDYGIPAPPSGQTFDRSKVNVQFTPGGGAAQSLGYNQGCAGGTGWQYDDANNPTRILACDGTCNSIKASSGKVDIVFGCETKTGNVK
jgi:hypothetical protein